MNKLKQEIDDALATINSALTILEDKDDIKQSDNINFHINLSPIDFLFDILKATKFGGDVKGCYEKVLEWIEDYVVYAITPLELSIKTILITSLKNLLNCSLNPIIPNEVLKYGILFDIREIDQFNQLTQSPFTHSEFYFNIQKPKIMESQIKTNDFNLLLWFLMNNPNLRISWGGERNVIKSNNLQFKQDGRDLNQIFNDKSTKEGGVITVEYHSNCSNILNAEGGAMENAEFPDRNCLQVFIGNTQTKNCWQNIGEKYDKMLTILNSGSNTDENHKELDDLKTAITQSKNEYRDIEENYYYKRTYFEFCWDYIWSMRLFDIKVLIARLLDSIFNYTSIDINFSIEKQLQKSEIENIVEKIIETDDIEINDCFFAFDNETYNDLLNQSENIYKGLQNINSNDAIKLNINLKDVFNQINNINENASKEEQKSVLKGIMREISANIQPIIPEEDKYKYTIPNTFAFSNFINLLMKKLAQILTEILISPKLMLILMMTKKIMGKNSTLNFMSIINEFKKTLVDCIRKIRDNILTFFFEKINKIVNDLAEQIGKKISIEQYMYYYKLIRKLIDCFKLSHEYIGWNSDFVNYADIYTDQNKITPIEEC